MLPAESICNFEITAIRIASWEPARPLQRSLGPSGPEIPKKSRKCLPGPPAPGPQKVSKQSKNTLQTLSGDSPETSRTAPETFLRLFGASGAGGPERHFRDFFGISGPEGARDLCKGRAGSQIASGLDLKSLALWASKVVGLPSG